MALPTKNRRTDKRVAVPIVIQFRKKEPKENDKWDMSLVRNISKSGFFFNSSFHFRNNDELEIKIYNPLTEKIDDCVCEVVRSIKVKEHCLFSETAVSLKELYNESIKSFNSFIDRSMALL